MSLSRRPLPALHRALSCALLGAFLAIALAACGKRGQPLPPPGPHFYPRVYPSE